MYLTGENDHRMDYDWRPEIHDSDGLSCGPAAENGSGAHWSTPHVHLNVLLDNNPRGFGLLQRDRNFNHYQDDGVFYDKRPSVWVEPLGTGAR